MPTTTMVAKQKGKVKAGMLIMTRHVVSVRRKGQTGHNSRWKGAVPPRGQGHFEKAKEERGEGGVDDGHDQRLDGRVVEHALDWCRKKNGRQTLQGAPTEERVKRQRTPTAIAPSTGL